MWSIKRNTLQMVLEASKDSYPREFGALLRAQEEVIYEIALVPGTIQSERYTMFYMYNRPIDFSYVGSVHSHPSGVRLPSDADLRMFSLMGPVHIIVGYPFGIHDYTGYNRKGDQIEIELL